MSARGAVTGALVCATLTCAVLAISSHSASAQHLAERLMASALAPRARRTPRWPRRPLLDAATEAATLTTLRRERGFDGAGATICIVDTGVDLSHRDFADAAGRTRASFVVDLGAPPRGRYPELEARIGAAVFDASDVDAHAVGLPGDPRGHGTAVASVALGDDSDVGEAGFGAHAGAAPRASLVVVRLDPVSAAEGLEVGFSDDSIERGVEACFVVAPIERTVAVIALGGHDGRHDGTEPLDLALDALAERGARIVVAAGNDGGTRVHAAGHLRSGDRARVDIVVPAPDPPAPSRFVALAVEGEVDVVAIAPDGSRSGPVGLGGSARVAHGGGEIAVDATHGEVRYVVLAGADEASLSGGRYALELSAPLNAHFDVWMVGHDVGAAILAPRLDGSFAVEDSSVTIPGTARGAITVGATLSRDRIDGLSGEIVLSERVGDVAAFSSRGPSSDGRPKPELVAPGALLGIALSSDLDPDDPTGLFGGSRGLLERRRLPGGRAAVAGTSFSAPLVAGTLALLLGDAAFAPAADLGPADEARRDVRLLAFSARPLLDVPWSPAAGFGALDAAAFFDARILALSRSRADVPARVVSTLTRPAELGGAFVIVGRAFGPDGAPWSGALALRRDDADADADAASLPVIAEDGVLVVRVDTPRGLPGATVGYTLRDANGTVVDHILVRLRIDEARDITPPTLGGGGTGCGVAGSRPPRFLGITLALALAIARAKPRSKPDSKPRSTPRPTDRR